MTYFLLASVNPSVIEGNHDFIEGFHYSHWPGLDLPSLSFSNFMHLNWLAQEELSANLYSVRDADDGGVGWGKGVP